MIYDTEVLKSNVCDYNEAYILVRSDITIIGNRVIKEHSKTVHHLLSVSQKLMD